MDKPDELVMVRILGVERGVNHRGRPCYWGYVVPKPKPKSFLWNWIIFPLAIAIPPFALQLLNWAHEAPAFAFLLGVLGGAFLSTIDHLVNEPPH